MISGDITEAKLGISESDLNLLRNKVNVVFHAAATVRFDEDLKVALEINLLGTQKVVEFCRQLKHLEVSDLLQHPRNLQVPTRAQGEFCKKKTNFVYYRLSFTYPPLIVIVIVAKSTKRYTQYHGTSRR